MNARKRRKSLSTHVISGLLVERKIQTFARIETENVTHSLYRVETENVTHSLYRVETENCTHWLKRRDRKLH